ncbi:MAG: low molecular weight phosphotyrosine protein phosphatase [Burkholderiales bacterium]|nr:low molecular weight phosphotyrosine protein phosphatase [Burkholderiales bacterium]
MKALRRWLGRGAAPTLRVLMVCSGNICRSPTAEGVLRARLDALGLGARIEVGSAGTQDLHAGEAPDPRAIAAARSRGYDLSALRARRVVGGDFMRFDRMLAMDEGHRRWLERMAPPEARARVELLMNHAQRYRDQPVVPDPYYGSGRDFERMLDLVEDACEGLVRALREELAARDAERAVPR